MSSGISSNNILESSLPHRLGSTGDVRAFFNAVADNALVIFWHFDEAGCLTSLEGRGLQNINLHAHKLIGLGLSALSQDFPNLVLHAKEAFHGSQIQEDMELCGHWFQTTFVPDFDLSQKICGVIGVSIDITERKRAEEDLQRSLERFAIAQEASNIGAFEFNIQTQLSTWTPQLEALMGLKTGEFDGSAAMWQRLVHPQDYPDLKRHFQNTIDGAEDYDHEFRVIRPDGDIRWFQTRAKLTHDTKGQPTIISGVNIDITEQRQIQHQLQVTRERFDLVAESAPLGIWFCDLPAELDKPIRWNDELKRQFGFSPDTVVTLGLFLKHLHPDDLEPTQRAIESAIQNRSRYEIDYRAVLEDGRHRWIRAVGRVHFDDQGLPIRFDGVTIDVTAQKEAQDELLRAKRAAEVANEAKTRFLANMSHEIRTPLGAILGFAELMKDVHQNATERAECLQTILRNGQLLSRVINEILDLSKIESEKLELELIPFHLGEALHDIIALLTLQAQEKGLRLTLHFEESSSAAIVSDPTRLRQILINLIGNSIKFTDRGRVSVFVRLLPVTSSQRQQVEFLVQDTGVGIEPEHQRRLFKPFMQADSSTTRKYGGTGLGLVLSQHLARALGGDLQLRRSALGEGSTFCLTIDAGPLTDDLSPTCDIKPAIPEVTPAAALTGARILIVEDSPDNRILISRFLKVAGAQIATAVDGVDGVERALSGNFDVVLMDIQMPRMDGILAIKILREKGYDRPIIALTAHAMKGDRERCLNAGADHYLVKPIDRQALVETIQFLRSSPTTGPMSFNKLL